MAVKRPTWSLPIVPLFELLVSFAQICYGLFEEQPSDHRKSKKEKMENLGGHPAGTSIKLRVVIRNSCQYGDIGHTTPVKKIVPEK